MKLCPPPSTCVEVWVEEVLDQGKVAALGGERLAGMGILYVLVLNLQYLPCSPMGCLPCKRHGFQLGKDKIDERCLIPVGPARLWTPRSFPTNCLLIKKTWVFNFRENDEVPDWLKRFGICQTRTLDKSDKVHEDHDSLDNFLCCITYRFMMSLLERKTED